MTLLQPLGLIGLSAVPLLVILYFLSRRRTVRAVSSLLFWPHATSERKRTLHLDPRSSRSLLLQIAAVIFLSLALTRPVVTLPGGITRDETVIVMDASASMKARSGSATRFDRAREAASRLIRTLPASSSVRIVVASAENSIAYSGPQPGALSAVTALEPTDTTAHLEDAVSLALALLEPGRKNAVEVITDGAVDGVSLRSTAIPVHMHVAGEDAGNMGIVGFTLRAQNPPSGGTEVLTTVANFTGETQETTLHLTFDGEPPVNRPVVLAPEETASYLIVRDGKSPGRATAALDITDALAEDNTAFAVSNYERPLSLLLAGPGNLFLERILAVYPGLRVTRSERYEPGENRYDLVIIDGGEETALEAGRFLLVNTPLRAPWLSTRGYGAPRGTAVRMTGHPLLADVPWENVTVFRALLSDVSPPGISVVGRNGNSLFFAYRDQRLRLVSLPFDLRDSTLVLTPSFPILMDNILRWLRPDLTARQASHKTGELLPVPSTGAQPVQITDPAGRPVTPVETEHGPAAILSEHGVYRIVSAAGETFAAANISDVAEANLHPRLSVPAAADEATVEKRHSGVLLPLIFMCAALLLLGMEWYVRDGRGA